MPDELRKKKGGTEMLKKGIAAILVGVLGVFGGQAMHAGADADKAKRIVPETAMIDLTAALGTYARERRPGFLLVGNGSTALLEVTEDNPEENVVRLMRALDGFFHESVLYDGYEEAGKAPGKNDGEMQDYLRAMLRKPLLAGKRVFTLDYVKGDRIRKVEDWGRAEGYVSEAGDRLLDVIPERAPMDENDRDVKTLADAKNFLVLLNPERFKTRAAYVGALAATNYDLLIVDLYYGDEPLTIEETTRLKRKANGGRRLLLSYMSVGEAADYRPYWQAAWNEKRPPWIAEPNPEWPGSYKTRYWSKAWRDILYGSDEAYLDKILAAGFDGAFLDVMDAWFYFKG